MLLDDVSTDRRRRRLDRSFAHCGTFEVEFVVFEVGNGAPSAPSIATVVDGTIIAADLVANDDPPSIVTCPPLPPAQNVIKRLTSSSWH